MEQTNSQSQSGPLNSANAYGGFTAFVVASLFAIILAAAWESGSLFLYGDSTANYLVVRSLAEDFDLDLRNQLAEAGLAPSGQVALGASGQWYPVHELLLPIISLPVYLLLGRGGLLLVNILIYGLALFLVFKIVAERFSPQAAALSVILCCGINSGFVTFSGDVLGALIFLSAWYSVERGRMFWAGLFSSLLLFARLPLLICVPGLVLYHVLRRAITTDSTRLNTQPGNDSLGKEIVVFVIAAVPVALLFLLSNWLLFGSPLSLSYNNWLPGNTDSILPQKEIFGAIPFREGVVRLLFDRTSGFFVVQPLYLPALLLSVGSLVRCFRAETIFILATHLVLVLLYSTFPGNQYYPMRYFFVPEFLYTFFLAACIQRALNGIRPDQEYKRSQSLDPRAG